MPSTQLFARGTSPKRLSTTASTAELWLLTGTTISAMPTSIVFASSLAVDHVTNRSSKESEDLYVTIEDLFYQK